MAKEILFNSKINEYTLKKEINSIQSIKKVPLKFKLSDLTAKFRRELLKESLKK